MSRGSQASHIGGKDVIKLHHVQHDNFTRQVELIKSINSRTPVSSSKCAIHMRNDDTLLRDRESIGPC
jgi:hypothetical protein